MKKSLFFLILFILPVPLSAQDDKSKASEVLLTDFSNADSLKNTLSYLSEDTTKAIALSDLAYAYAFSEAEKGMEYAKTGLQLSQKIGYKKGIASNMHSMGTALWSFGSYDKALQYAFDALHIFEELKDQQKIGFCYVLLSIIYRDAGDYENALINSHQSAHILNATGVGVRVSYANLGSIHDLQDNLDSALYYMQLAHELDVQINEGKWDWIYWVIGNIEAKKQHYTAAMINYRTALSLAKQTNIFKTIVESYNGIAQVHYTTGNLDSCIYYTKEALQKWQSVSYQKGLLNAAGILANAYKKRNEIDSAIKYLEYRATLNDKLFNQQLVKNIQSVGFNEQMRIAEIERERKAFNESLKLYAVIAAGISLLLITLLLWRNNLHRKKAYLQLEKQKAETEFQKEKAEASFKELQTVQAQLIQSEKMASLGELTAGIAHEIQNPLNFVNNFSDVNKELIDELKAELATGNVQEANNIADDIKDNSEKINHHGKRADAIVKGMLQHSRKSEGSKEPTDINKLCDEYLRLSYHGLRAKDKNFNATLETNFDESIGKINIIPQDMGRVLLNLFNNAFYAVNEKQKQNPTGYDPKVSISTKAVKSPLGDLGVSIIVSDNGNGIPANIIDKIFQPFFTTKPTGSGTGLGLSLAYDIVKTHGGELQVESKEGGGSKFFITIPIK